jgi:stringent starvation protein B
MTSNKPYLLRALNEWILDNGQTPHVIVDINAEGVDVPDQAIQDGKLVLNIAPQATRDLEISNEFISFQARFAGAPYDIFLPIDAVMAIYARENGQGMMFAQGKEEAVKEDAGKENSKDDASNDKPDDDSSRGPHLKLIK